MLVGALDAGIRCSWGIGDHENGDWQDRAGAARIRAYAQSCPARALRNFALEAAALLSDDLRAGAEVEFDVVDEEGRAGRRSTATSRASTPSSNRAGSACASSVLPRRLPRARRRRVQLAADERPARRAGRAGAAGHARAPLRGRHELRLPEERFERVYSEVEGTLYRDAVRARLLAPLDGASMDAERVELGGGLSLVRGDLAEAPREAVYPEGGDGEPALLCVLERDVPAGESIPAAEAAERFASVVARCGCGRPGRSASGRRGGGASAAGAGRRCPSGGGAARRRVDGTCPPARSALLRLLRRDRGGRAAANGGVGAGALRDGLRPPPRLRGAPGLPARLRALLDATSDAGEASLALRVAALCAEEGSRRAVQRRVEAALALERFVMGGGPRARRSRSRRASWSPRSRGTCARCCATCSAATSTPT